MNYWFYCSIGTLIVRIPCFPRRFTLLIFYLGNPSCTFGFFFTVFTVYWLTSPAAPSARAAASCPAPVPAPVPVVRINVHDYLFCRSWTKLAVQRRLASSSPAVVSTRHPKSLFPADGDLTASDVDEFPDLLEVQDEFGPPTPRPSPSSSTLRQMSTTMSRGKFQFWRFPSSVLLQD
jgi:hypothetical protein